MADGLTLDEVMSYGQPKRASQYQWDGGAAKRGDAWQVQAEPQDGDLRRVEVILSDIYARHGINPDLPPADAAMQVAARAESQGVGQSMWANPEERAAARKEYALKGKTPAEVKQRWDESARLMDPDTQAYYQNYVRDMSFLQGLQGPGSVEYGVRSDSVRGPHEEALRYWDRSNLSPIWSDYGSTNQDGAWMAYGMSDPDSTVGSYLEWSEQVPNAIRMWGSGESHSAGAPTSLETSSGLYQFNRRHRPMHPAPIGNLPPGASREDRANAVRELQRQYLSAKSAINDTDRRWAQTTGWVPPQVVQDVADNLTSTADPTLALSLVAPAAAVARFARPAAGVVGSGWVRPAAGQLARSTAGMIGSDQAWEQGAGLGLITAIDPSRPSQASYWRGTTDVQDYLHTPEQLNQAKRDRAEIVANADPAGVSTADNAAYGELVRERRVPFGWHDGPKAATNK